MMTVAETAVATAHHLEGAALGLPRALIAGLAVQCLNIQYRHDNIAAKARSSSGYTNFSLSSLVSTSWCASLGFEITSTSLR
jgi:hypothetical protein